MYLRRPGYLDLAQLIVCLVVQMELPSWKAVLCRQLALRWTPDSEKQPSKWATERKSHHMVLVKKGSEHANTSRRLARSVCLRSVRAICVLPFAKFTKCAQYTMAVRMRIGIYTVRKLRDDTVAMGLRFCLHEVVAKNRSQFATFFWQVP